MKKKLTIALAFAAAIGLSSAVFAEDQAPATKKDDCSSCPMAKKCCGDKAAQADAKDAKKITPQTKCPVQGGDIDKSLFVDVDGKRIYVCCSGCIDEIKKNPKKYIKELEDKGITLDKAK